MCMLFSFKKSKLFAFVHPPVPDFRAKLRETKQLIIFRVWMHDSHAQNLKNLNIHKLDFSAVHSNN